MEPGEEKVNGGSVVDLLGVHAFHEAEVVGNLCGVWHEGAHRGSGLAVFFKWLDGGEEPSFVRGGRHGGETFSFHVGIGDALAVEFLEFGFVVEKFEVRGATVLKEVNNALCLRGDFFCGIEDLVLRGGGIRSEKMGEGGDAKTGGRFAEEVTTIGEELGFEKGIHVLLFGEGFVGVEEGEGDSGESGRDDRVSVFIRQSFSNG